MATVGAPPKYTPEVCDWLLEYVTEYEPFKTLEVKSYDKDGNEIIQGKLVPSGIPSIVDFCHNYLPEKHGIKIARTSFWNSWLKDYPELENAFKEFQELRKAYMMSQANSGLVPPGTYKFNAINLTDMVDRQEVKQDNTFSDGINFTLSDQKSSYIEYLKQRNEQRDRNNQQSDT